MLQVRLGIHHRTHGVPGARAARTRGSCSSVRAPGADEDAAAGPFVGRAGQLLDKIIAACGLKREDVYIANILKCRPPDNRDPARTKSSVACLLAEADRGHQAPGHRGARGPCRQDPSRHREVHRSAPGPVPRSIRPAWGSPRSGSWRPTIPPISCGTTRPTRDGAFGRGHEEGPRRNWVCPFRIEARVDFPSRPPSRRWKSVTNRAESANSVTTQYNTPHIDCREQDRKNRLSQSRWPGAG